jgi:hypothetical protein
MQWLPCYVARSLCLLEMYEQWQLAISTPQ